MRQKLWLLPVGIVMVVVLVVPTHADGGTTKRAQFHLGTTAHDVGAPTGLAFRVLYRDPKDPRGKPPSLESARFRLPRGMEIDTGAVQRCLADDAQIRTLGRAACPSGSKVGHGKLIARTGIPGADRVRTDVVAFNGPDQIIEVVFFEGTNTVAGIDRLSVQGNVLTAHPPTTPGGPPDGRTAVRRILLWMPMRLGPDRRPYVQTPSRCWRGYWRSTGHFSFADGGRTTVGSRTRCTS